MRPGVTSNQTEIGPWRCMLRPNAKISKFIFSIYDFLRRSRKKKTSIDGLKWRDLVMGRWWLVNFNVSAVRCHKGFHVLNSARQASPCKRPRARGHPIPPQSYSISKYLTRHIYKVRNVTVFRKFRHIFGPPKFRPSK